MGDRVLDDYHAIRVDYPAVKLWVDQAIWGHRLHDEPSAELVFLEFLNVVRSIASHSEPFIAGQTIEDARSIRTSYQDSLLMRTILFNNPTIDAPLAAGKGDAEAWEAQREALFAACSHYGGMVKRYGIDGADFFKYLQSRFANYRAYVNLVRVLRMDAIEGDSRKRWTSRFLFPYTWQALFGDLRDSDLSADRRFFTRSGELAYLMLARSGHGKSIWHHLRPVLFESAPHSERWNRAIRGLMHDRELEGDRSGKGEPIGYLPRERHDLFEAFGEDFLNLLKAGLPQYDVVPYLTFLTTFYLMHYLLVVAAEDLGRPASGRSFAVQYVLEIMADRSDLVRRISRDSYQGNNELPRLRLRAALDSIRDSEGVNRALEADRADLLRQALQKWWDEVYSKPKMQTAQGIWGEFSKGVMDRHKQHLADVHHRYARSCGLASKKRTNSYRYAPSDDFLRMLVLANVRSQVPYDQFVDLLYMRYGFIIAKRHAAVCGLAGDVTDFDSNDYRLQSRLTRLGMVRRLSDACAYVVNRYID